MQRIFHFHIAEVMPYINWLYFFHAWGFPVRYAGIAKVHGCEACRNSWLQTFAPEDRKRAKEAMTLYDDAQQVLRESAHQYQTHALVSILPAYSENEDVVVSIPRNDKAEFVINNARNDNDDLIADDALASITIPFLRQQTPGENGYCLCISDFIRPKEKGEDKIGIFACSTDKAMEDSESDDAYRHLLHQTLADRLAEATAERMHEMVRKDLWGFSPDENLTIDEMFAERYQGLRPAVGYPSIPDQSIAFLIDQVAHLGQIGITLTDSGAMIPHASTCGFILSHPSSMHFSIGMVEEDQISDYAKRRGMKADELRRFLQ